MKKYFIFFLFLFFCFPYFCFALEYPNVDSKSFIVFDRTDNKVLYSYNSDQVKSVASLTKIVTTIVAIEKISDLNQTITISPEIINSVDPVASKAGLRVGDVVTYRDLLYASILPSGADATNALAISLSGSVNNFVSDMNSFLKKLGLSNTNFVNVVGLDDDNHYSTADDILKILNYSLNNSVFYEIFTTKKYTLSNGLDVYSTLYKYNGDDISEIIGSKTGFTGNAGYCIATLSKTDGHEIIIVLLDAEHKNNRYYNIIDSLSLINYVNENYSNNLLLKKNSLIISLPVELSDIDTYNIYSKNDIYKFLPNDYDNNLFVYKFDGVKSLNYKNKKGKKIGEIKYFYDGNLIYKESVFLNQDINISIVKVIKKYFIYEIFAVLLFLLLIFLLLRKKIHKKRHY